MSCSSYVHCASVLTVSLDLRMPLDYRVQIRLTTVGTVGALGSYRREPECLLEAVCALRRPTL